MSILFISDLHLSSKNPKIVNGFLHFLTSQAVKASALYILGDLFEIWLGDDDQNILHINVAQGLKTLIEKKIPCYFIHGNHDFLLGSKYANTCGMILLPTYQTIRLSSGKSIMILHGDSLCVNDKQYIRLKKVLNCYIFQKLFLSLPFSIRLHIYNIIYSYYEKYKQYQEKNKLYINDQFVVDMLIKNKSEIMIHGHTHQPAMHNIYYSKCVTFKRIVLGNWDKNSGSVAKINEIDHTISLKKFSLDIS